MSRHLLRSMLVISPLLASACSSDAPGDQGTLRSSTSSHDEPIYFSGSRSVPGAAVFEVLPGPAAIDSSLDPTPFSDNTTTTDGSYSLTVDDTDSVDSVDSADAVTSVDIRFTGNDGTHYAIDAIRVIHKPEGTGDHSFLGGVGRSVEMHGDTGIGTALMPKMLAYITLWGVTDLKNADTGDVIAAGRLIHIMTATRVRDADRNLLTDTDTDGSDHDRTMAETHVILPPKAMDGSMSPVPGTDHGFLHMMFSGVDLTEPTRDPTLVYEILPGPSVLSPDVSPTPFSNRTAVGWGSYSLAVRDFDDEDSTTSRDTAVGFQLSFRQDDGRGYTIDGLQIIHKEAGTGDHSFLGGVGYDVTMHGDTGIGTGMMPKMTSYITLWATADLLDESGVTVAPNRVVHVMVGSRVRDADLALGTDAATDASDHGEDVVETHIILPPRDMMGASSPVPGTRHGFLHLMFERVSLSR